MVPVRTAGRGNASTWRNPKNVATTSSGTAAMLTTDRYSSPMKYANAPAGAANTPHRPPTARHSSKPRVLCESVCKVFIAAGSSRADRERYRGARQLQGTVDQRQR